MKRLEWLKQHLPQKVWDNLATVSILGLLAVLAVFGWKITDLIGSNHDRIVDIQQSRRSSCVATYRAFLDVFRPFFPTDRSEWTPQQEKNWRKLEHIVDKLSSNCDQQVRPKGRP